MPEKEETIASRPTAANLIRSGATPARLERISQSQQSRSRAMGFAQEMGVDPRDQEWLAKRWGISYPEFNWNWI